MPSLETLRADLPVLIPWIVFERVANRAELAEARVDALKLAARIALEHHARQHVACAGEEPTCDGCRALQAVQP